MTTSLWEAIAEKKSYPILQKDLETDVLIVGGGITGVSTAYWLQQAGLKVCLIEAHHLGSGVTGKTTAHLTTAVDAKYSATANNISKEAARLLAKASLEAIGSVEELDKKENLQSRFRRMPAYLYAASEEQVKWIQEELKASREVDLPVEEVSKANGLPFETGLAIKYNNNATFNPLIYIYNLAEKLSQRGVEIYEKTRAGHYEEKDGKVIMKVATGHTITAKQVVMATHMPIHFDPVQTMAAPYRSYAIAFTTESTPVPEALYYDWNEPYHYIRPADYHDRKVWVVGGADHKTGQGNEQQAFDKLKAYIEERFDVATYLQGWSAQVYDPIDGLPYIGKSVLHDHIYISTGYAGDGTLWGSLSAKILTDIITGKKNAYAELFSPSRINFKGSAKQYIKENADVAWHFVTDRFKSDADNVRDVPRGEGRIIMQGMDQYAVYRDEGGQVHVMSSTCVHMKCKVSWNNAEKTWDCPCHGGRYAPTGEVLEGPPHHGLKGKEM